MNRTHDDMPTDAESPRSPHGSAGGETRGPAPDRRALERRRTVGDVLTQIALPVAALALASFAGWYVWRTRPVERTVPPPMPPSRSPFRNTLACAGIVEAQSENIAIGSPTAGVVVEVLVAVGDEVAAGSPLFRLDDRELRGSLAVQRAVLAQANADLVQTDAEPRQETIPPLIASVREAEAASDAAADALRRAETLFAQGVITEQDVITKRDQAAYAAAAVEKAEAELALKKAGAWTYDRDVAKAAADRAQAELEKIEGDLERLTIRSLVAAEVLQVNIRPGEFVGTPPGQPLVVVGDVDRLHVRVDIDEFEIGRFDPAAPAKAMPRGSPSQVHTLSFVRVEPFVVPKKSLTGDNSERVDTRVLQVIYQCEPNADGTSEGARSLFVGQQVDVFIESQDKVPASPVAASPSS